MPHLFTIVPLQYPSHPWTQKLTIIKYVEENYCNHWYHRQSGKLPVFVDTAHLTQYLKGASVAEEFIALPNWHVRGISRDPTKPSAQEWIAKGAEVVQGDLDNPSSLKAAFEDAHVIFGNTDLWQHMSNPTTHERAAKENRTPNEVAYDLEVEQGKNLVDVVAEVNRETGTLERFVYSILSDTKGISKGRITFNLHFDSKWATVEYLRERHPELNKKTSLLQLGIFASNWKIGGHKPHKQEDGSYKVSLPLGGDVKFPMVDPNADTGRLTKALVDVPAGKNLVGAGSVVTWNEWCENWSKVCIRNFEFTKARMP